MQYISLFFYLLIKCFHMKVNFCFITFSMADDDDESAVFLFSFYCVLITMKWGWGWLLAIVWHHTQLTLKGGQILCTFFTFRFAKNSLQRFSQSVLHLFIYSSFSTFKHTITLCIYDILYIIFVEIKKNIIIVYLRESKWSKNYSSRVFFFLMLQVIQSEMITVGILWTIVVLL